MSWALRFDGVDDRIQATSKTLTTFTFVMRVRFNSLTPAGRCLFHMGSQGPCIYFNGTAEADPRKLYAGYWTSSWAEISFSSSVEVVADTFYQIALIRDGSTLKLYIDGTEVGSVAATTNPGTSLTHGMRIGAAAFSSTPEEYLPGDFTDFRIYTDAKSASDLATIESNTTNLVRHYAFDEGTGSTVTDLGSDNLDGTIIGATWVALGETYSESIGLGGSAGVTPAARLGMTAAMTLGGGAGLSQGGRLGLSEAATLAGTGALAAAAGKLATGEIGLDGVAGASATAGSIIGLAATLSGSLGISTTPALQMALAATLAGAQGITTAGSAVMGGSVEIGAQGDYEALPTAFLVEQATLALGGGIGTAGGLRLSDGVGLSGSLGADLAPAWRLAGTIDLGSSGGLDFGSRQDASDAIAFGAVASASASAATSLISDAVTIGGLLSATVAGRLRAMAAAGLDLFGSADASARLGTMGAISLDGTPEFVGAAGLRIAAGAAFDVTAAATVEGGLRVAGSISLSGGAGVAVAGRGDVQGTVTFEATLDAAAAGSLSIAEAISLAAQHALDVVGFDPSTIAPKRVIRLTGLMLGTRALTGSMVLTARLEGVKATRRPLIGRIS